MKHLKSSRAIQTNRNSCLSLKGTIHAFWERTSISGLSNAGNKSHHWFRRVCWMAIFIVFSGLTFYGLWNVINDYLEYPVVTSVRIENKEAVCSFIKSNSLEFSQIVEFKSISYFHLLFIGIVPCDNNLQSKPSKL